MNRPFDAAEIIDRAMDDVEQGSGSLILSPSAPLLSARELIRRRYMVPGLRTLHHLQGTFLLWTGTHYREIEREEIKAVIYEFLDAAKMVAGDKTTQFNPNRNRVADVLDALAGQTQLPGTVRAPTWLDDKFCPPATGILACTNGLLDLSSRTLLDHTPKFFGINAVDYVFDPAAGQPRRWLDFLHTIWPDDPESITTLQEMFGLLLTSDTSHQKAFLTVGPKRSGKGTIARVLTAMLGKENVAGPTLSSLTQNFGLAPLIGMPLAIISDARLGGRADVNIAVERLLAITGEDGITVDRKFRKAWTGRLPTRFLMLTNELPRLTDASGALASRFIVLIMTRSFFGLEDASLTGKLLAELPGILLWAIDGRDRLIRRGHFLQPQSANDAIEELTDLGSPVGAFVRERCVVNALYATDCGVMFAAWTSWCRENNREHPGTVQMFGRDLKAVIPGLTITNNREGTVRNRNYQGVGLASS